MDEIKKIHHWEVLAVSCIDGRFIKRTVDWLSEKTDGVFDFRTEIGATKAIIDCKSERDGLCNVIEISLRLHGIKELYLIDHVDCGAYGGSAKFASASEEKNFHIEKLNQASEILHQKYPNLEIKKVYVDWEEIEIV